MFNKFALAAISAVALLGSIPAQAESLRGDAFITAMYDNTLTGKAPNGTPYRLYFVPGGQATIQEGNRAPQVGTWNLDRAGNVCLKWPSAAAAEDGCYTVQTNGTHVTLSNKAGWRRGRILGGVAPLEMSKSN
jgi:hypothetical protein